MIVSFASCNALDGEVFIKPIIAVETNSNELYAAKKYCSYNEAEIFEYSSVYDAVVAVENGKADYVVLDEYTATTVIDAGAELELYEDTTFSMEFCAYFSNDNDVLSKEFDAAVKKLIDNGTIEHIVETHKKGGVVSFLCQAVKKASCQCFVTRYLKTRFIIIQRVKLQGLTLTLQERFVQNSGIH